MTTEFKAVTPQRAVQIMKAWAYHPWPITFDEGTRIYTSLGFVGDPAQPRYFTSDMSPTKPDSLFHGKDNMIDGVRLQISNRILSDDNRTTSHEGTRTHYYSIRKEFLRTLPTPYSSKDTETRFSTQWFLHNGVGVRLGGNMSLISITLESPTQAKYHIEELEAEASGEEIGADYF